VSATAVTPAELRDPEAAPSAAARISEDAGAGATAVRFSSSCAVATSVAWVVTP
jgi:hypothetical protein